MADIIRDELLAALIAAEEHLDFCGYGDTYERECATAAGLPSQITEAIENATKYE